MFDTPGPRLFGLPPGADFGSAVVRGLLARLKDTGPDALARVTIFVNTRRMQRRLREVFDTGPARLLPRIRLITDLAFDPVAGDAAPPAAPLRRRLELMQLVAKLIETQADIPQSAAFDLADALATLMDEMQGEGVSPEVLETLDVSQHSEYWARSLKFLTLVQPYFDPISAAPDREARQRMVIERLVEKWQTEPPDGPVIAAGSTGSRGATALFLDAVARLPHGAVILPGFDFEMPDSVWDRLGDALTAEDHPQARFQRLIERLGLGPGDVARWDAAPEASVDRNRLISLSLRPAPVTDQWAVEGPKLTGIADACDGLTLVEAPHPRIEAESIALRLRHAVEEGITAALITPDRMLTRQVAAALDRWRIVPDDSAGTPLSLSPPGRLLRQVAQLFGAQATGTDLLALLKHPLVNREDGTHLLMSRELEQHLRRYGPAFPDTDALLAWANDNPQRQDWARWIGGLIAAPDGKDAQADWPLADWVSHHIAVSKNLAAGPGSDGSGPLWEDAAGREAQALVANLALHADAGGIMSAQGYRALFEAVIATAVVRDRDRGHPQVLIWGTLEARVQSADLVILAGMNDGTWPESPRPDPWLNRAMRLQAGLLLPERRIGLSAHDFQQAVAGREVWITRSLRSDDAETVPSRWVNRLQNLLGGLPEQGGAAALDAMRARGGRWVAAAMAHSVPETTVPPAPRPSPRPPVAARPRELSVTAISRLIRDPYAIYARSILHLKLLDPLTLAPDAALRGTVLHDVFDRFITAGIITPEALMRATDVVLAKDCPWPTTRHLWRARIRRIADGFARDEIARQASAMPLPGERIGRVTDTGLGFTLTARADRIDTLPDGSVIIYDYKTGKPPSAAQQEAFDKQLLLEAAMAERGGFPELGHVRVASAAYIGVGTEPKIVAAPLGDDLTPTQIWQDFSSLIARWQDRSRGYSARLAMERSRFGSDYDHLSRFGEWDMTETARGEDVG